jgi:hypothetical protein
MSMAISHRFVLVLCICILFGPATVALEQGADKLNAKSLEAAASYADSLAQWGFVIVGGSLVLVLGNSHRWPKSRKLRSAYFLFLFAWVSLALSIYYGTRVHQAYLAYVLVPSTTVEGTIRTLNEDLANQILWMFGGLSILGGWLLLYLVWSISSKDGHNVRGDS